MVYSEFVVDVVDVVVVDIIYVCMDVCIDLLRFCCIVVGVVANSKIWYSIAAYSKYWYWYGSM
jgi:hypothetical protein